jgi:hypothetical protein
VRTSADVQRLLPGSTDQRVWEPSRESDDRRRSESNACATGDWAPNVLESSRRSDPSGRQVETSDQRVHAAWAIGPLDGRARQRPRHHLAERAAAPCGFDLPRGGRLDRGAAVSPSSNRCVDVP